MSWPKLKLESLAVKEPYSFVGGPFGSKLTTRDYVESGIPVIRGSNMNNGRYIDMADFVFVTESKVREDLSSNLAKPGDLIFTQRGTLGQVAIIPSDGISDRYVVSQSQMKLTVDKAKANGLFLYYFFSSREATERILSYVSSSGVPHINLTVMRNFEVPVPPIETQRGIARTLSAYDDLIENNRRRIQLLEQAARLLYKEWFVHLRFPGHEYARIIDGVPEGWEKTTFGDAVENFDRLRIPLSVMEREKRPGSFPYHGAAGILDHLDGFIFEGRFLLVGEDGTVVTQGNTAMLQLVEGKFWVSNHAHVVQGQLVSTEYLFCFMSHYPITGHITGVAQPKLSQRNLNRISMLIPPANLLDMFQDSAEPMFNQIFNLKAVCDRLAKARDLLLPKLMNGEVAV